MQNPSDLHVFGMPSLAELLRQGQRGGSRESTASRHGIDYAQLVSCTLAWCRAWTPPPGEGAVAAGERGGEIPALLVSTPHAPCHGMLRSMYILLLLVW
jgi:hypothetical protein